MTYLIAVSALFASMQPIVDKYNSAAGFVFTGIGIIAAAISLLSVFIEWGLAKVEAKRAKYHRL